MACEEKSASMSMIVVTASIDLALPIKEHARQFWEYEIASQENRKTCIRHVRSEETNLQLSAATFRVLTPREMLQVLAAWLQPVVVQAAMAIAKLIAPLLLSAILEELLQEKKILALALL